MHYIPSSISYSYTLYMYIQLLFLSSILYFIFLF